MASRLELQTLLETLLGTRNVYYQPPPSIMMKYTAIRYEKSAMDVRHANNKVYSKLNCYQITVISPDPDDPVIEKLLELQYCSWDRHYVADGLNHDVLTLYF